MNPRQLALEYTRGFVERGSTLRSISRQLGYWKDVDCVQIGGIVWENEGPQRLTRRQLAVLRLNDVPCLHIFDLRELYGELYSGVQPSLFSD